MALLTLTKRRMKCSGVSRWGGDGLGVLVADETGGSATDVLLPQAASRSRAASSGARVGGVRIEGLPPESAVDVG
jgi:hypothetical protein